jgi:hypothetical protein
MIKSRKERMGLMNQAPTFVHKFIHPSAIIGLINFVQVFD